MFLENEYARPLFDFEKGGPPKAFECLCMINTTPHCQHGAVYIKCTKVTRTERGMRMHLKSVHGWKEQPCLSSTDQCRTEPGAPRKLRAGAPNLNQGEKEVSQPKPTVTKESGKSPETKGKRSRKPTSEVKSDSRQMTLDGLSSATVTSTEATQTTSDTPGTETK